MKGKKRYRVTWHGQRFRRDMISAGYTQASLARAAGLTEPTISRIISGHGVSADLVRVAAGALGQPTSRYLLKIGQNPAA